MFLVGGPAYSGTTLLTLMLNQSGLVCLDEPDFHNPEQRHRGIPLLQHLFPAAHFPAPPTTALGYDEAVDLIHRCELAIAPRRLGMKTCNSVFLNYADVYQARGYPVIAIVRDIRDALVRPMPPWVTEESLNHFYREIWNARQRFDLWVRYEDLVRTREAVFASISRVLARELSVVRAWNRAAVHAEMLKSAHHDLLLSGQVSDSRIGIWKTAGKRLTRASQRTAQMMGYD
jgi:hypothetical protein